MRKTVSELMIQRLHEWGIRRIFGYPGAGINGIMTSVLKGDPHTRGVLQQTAKDMAGSVKARLRGGGD